MIKETTIVIMYDIFTIFGLIILIIIVLNSNVYGNENDEVKSLPGWHAPLSSKHYSGFLDGDNINNYKLHYWLVECENNPDNAPLVFWFNGGPGIIIIIIIIFSFHHHLFISYHFIVIYLP